MTKSISEIISTEYRFTTCIDCSCELKIQNKPRCHECFVKAEAKWKLEDDERLRKSKIITPELLREFERTSNIPSRFYGTGFKTFNVKANCLDVKKCKIKKCVVCVRLSTTLAKTIECAKTGKWVIFSGEINGIGKTRLAVDSLKYAYLFSGKVQWNGEYKRNYPESYGYYTIPSLLSSLYTAGINHDTIFNSVVDKRAVVFDEMGRESLVRDGNQSKAIVEELIAKIYDNGGLLIIVTPLPMDEFKDRYDGRIKDRLMECAEVIKVTGKSYRNK